MFCIVPKQSGRPIHTDTLRFDDCCTAIHCLFKIYIIVQVDKLIKGIIVSPCYTIEKYICKKFTGQPN